MRAPGTSLNGSGTKRSAVSAGPMQIAARQTLAREIELAVGTSSERIERRVQHVGLAAAQRRSNRRRAAVAAGQRIGRIGRVLGRAVQVVQAVHRRDAMDGLGQRRRASDVTRARSSLWSNGLVMKSSAPTAARSVAVRYRWP